LALIQSQTSPSNTLAVLPEGVIFNYLSRRPNPTPYTLFTLSEIQAFGETNMVEAFSGNQPDYVLLVHRDTSDWNVNYFGTERGYGYDLMTWVRANYSPAWLLGHEPLQTNLFGIKMLRRKELLPGQ
jgi:hypothetical protein